MRSLPGLTGALIGALLLAAAGCGERPLPPERWRFSAVPIYREPGTSEDPNLIFPRDILLLGGRLYLLDGRLAHVVVCDPSTGAVTGRFGGPGEGPGELGAYPHALVTDGELIGVVHLFQVSWFTPDGTFRARAPVPPHDLSSPSIQYTGGGWLVNTSFRGEGAPVARLVTAGGDTCGYGSARYPRHPDTAGLAAAELNAVHALRFGNGNVLLAWVQRNLIEVLDPAGEPVAAGEWNHFPRRPERRPDGRLLNLPGFTFAAGQAADGSVWVLDGTLRRVRLYEADGRLRGEHILEVPVMRLAWGRGALAYAIDGRDRILRLTFLGSDEGRAEPARSPTAGPDPGTAGMEPGSGGTAFPGELVYPAGNIEDLFRERGIWREGFVIDRSSPPGRLIAAGGDARLFAGYADGSGVLFTPVPGDGSERRLEPGPTLSASPHGSYRSRLVMAGDVPVVWDARAGIFPPDPCPALTWGAERFPSDVFSLGNDRWLVCDLRIRSGDPLLVADGGSGEWVEAGGVAAGAAERRRWEWDRGWLFDDRTDGAVCIFDADRMAMTTWREGTGVTWTALSDPAGRLPQRRAGGVPGEGVIQVAALPGRGILFTFLAPYRGNDRIWVAAVRPDGRIVGCWPVPGSNLISSLTVGPDAGIYLTTRTELFLWRGVGGIFE